MSQTTICRVCRVESTHRFLFPMAWLSVFFSSSFCCAGIFFWKSSTAPTIPTPNPLLNQKQSEQSVAKSWATLPPAALKLRCLWKVTTLGITQRNHSLWLVERLVFILNHALQAYVKLMKPGYLLEGYEVWERDKKSSWDFKYKYEWLSYNLEYFEKL